MFFGLVDNVGDVDVVAIVDGEVVGILGRSNFDSVKPSYQSHHLSKTHSKGRKRRGTAKDAITKQ